MTCDSRARVAPEIFDHYPDYRANIVYATDVKNCPSDDQSLRLLSHAARKANETFADVTITEHPHIASWRRTYVLAGSNPSRYRCSAEALLRRALKYELPQINWLVDLYNAISIEYVLPVGGENLDQVVGDVVLRIADGGELFETREQGKLVMTAADPGEPVWVDDAGVTCRRWNWRQSVRTALTIETTNAYFVLDALIPFTDNSLQIATEKLIDGLKTLSPQCKIELEQWKVNFP